MGLGGSDSMFGKLYDDLYKANNVDEIEKILKSYELNNPVYKSKLELNLLIIDLSYLTLVYPLSNGEFLGVQALYFSPITSNAKALSKAVGEEISEGELKEAIAEIMSEDPEIALLDSIKGKYLTLFHDKDKNKIIQALGENAEKNLEKLESIFEKYKQ